MVTASESLAKMAAKGSPDGRLPDSEGGSKGRGGRGPYKRDDTGLKPIPLKYDARTSYPMEIVERALELMDEQGSVHGAHVALSDELAEQGLKAPSYGTLWIWAREKEALLQSLTGGRKEQLVAVAGEVALKASERMLTALDKISDSQVPVAYGISMQKRTEWERTNSSGNQMNVQFNLVTRE